MDFIEENKNIDENGRLTMFRLDDWIADPEFDDIQVAESDITNAHSLEWYQ